MKNKTSSFFDLRNQCRKIELVSFYEPYMVPSLRGFLYFFGSEKMGVVSLLDLLMIHLRGVNSAPSSHHLRPFEKPMRKVAALQSSDGPWVGGSRASLERPPTRGLQRTPSHKTHCPRESLPPTSRSPLQQINLGRFFLRVKLRRYPALERRFL